MLRFREYRKKHNMTMKEVGDAIGVAESTVSLYETGKRQPDNETLVHLATLFETSVDELLGRKSPCSICGYSFVPEIPEEINRHEKIHQEFLLAREKYGFLWNDDEKNSIKNEAYEVLYNKKSSSAQVFFAAENICRVYFCRSLKTWSYDLRHPTFKQYVPMLLNLNHYKELFSKVYDKLVEKYGNPTEGILEGMTSVTELPLPSTISINNISETKLINTYRNLTPEGQKYILQTIDIVKEKFKKRINISENNDTLSSESDYRIAAAPEVTPAKVDVKEKPKHS